MKKTLSLLLAVLMVMSIIALPAMAATAGSTYPAIYTDVMDLSSYEDGTILGTGNVAATGVLSTAGIGTSIRTTNYGGVTTANAPYVQLVDISTQATEDSVSKVTVETVDGEKVIKLTTGQNYDNAGIALSPISGSILMNLSSQVNYYFDHYQPDNANKVNALNVGFAKIDADGNLSYFAVNELNGEDPSNVAAKFTNASFDPGKPNGVSPVYYWEKNSSDTEYKSKLYTINRHNLTTGAYLGGNGFGDGAKPFLNRTTADGTSVGVTDIAYIYDNWYSTSFGLSYLEDVGIRIKMQSSYQADKDATSNQGTCTIPLTAAELADLKNVKIVPIIALNSASLGARYTYLKDVRSTVEKNYDKVAGGSKVVMADNFESTAIGTTNQTSFNSDFLKDFGIYSQRNATGVSTSDNMSVSVAANPTYVGNNSAKVLKISGGATADSAKWAGFRSQPISTSVFTSSVDGGTVMYDVYRNNASSFGNGRLYFQVASDAAGTLVGSTSDDRSNTDKIMSHMTGNAKNMDFTFNSPNGTSSDTTLFSTNVSAGWYRIAFNLRSAADGTAIVKLRSCNLATGVWSDWTSDITFPLPLTGVKYLSWGESYNNGANVNLYYDNFKVIAGDISPVAEIAGSDAYIVMPSDSITVTLDAPVANEALLKSVKLVDDSGEEVAADVAYSIANGVTTVTIDPEEDLISETTYTVDFAGNKTAIGEAIVNSSFTVQEDWAAPAEAPVVTFDGDAKLVGDEVLTVSMEVDGSAVDTAGYVVYSDSDAVTVTAGDGVYEITAAKSGAANIYVQSLLYPGAGVSAYAVETETPEAAYTVTFYADGEVVHTEKVSANAVPEGFTVDDETFAGWAAEEGGAVVSLAPVTADTSYYAILSELIDVEVVASNDEYAEIIDTVMTIPAGSTLPYAPDYILADEDVYGLTGWMIDGVEYTTEELLALHISEPITITANFVQNKFLFGDEYDLTTITPEEFAVSPFAADSDFVLTEGTGMELVKAAQTGYNFAFQHDETPEGTYVIEFDYIANTDENSKFQGYDSSIFGNPTDPKKLHGVYLTNHETAELFYEGTGEKIKWNSNQYIEYGVKHTMQYVMDFTTGKFATVIDGEANLVQNSSFGYDLANADAGAPRIWAPSVKAGGSLLMTRFAFYKTDDSIVKVSVEADEIFDAVGFSNTDGAVNTRTEIYMLPGTKIELASKITDVEYELDSITADAGTVENVDGAYYYTAGTSDAVISFASKTAYITATFDVGEGTLVSGEVEQTLIKGQTPVAPEVTAPEGKVFIGWTPAVGAITTDTIYEAVYTDAETVDVTFVAENEDSANIDMTIKAIKGGNLIALPNYEAINGATFLYWEDEAGNQYTTEELAEIVFDSDATIQGVFKQAYVTSGVYDFTQHAFELSAWDYADAEVYEINEDGSVHIDAAAQADESFIFAAAFPEVTTGTWMLELDMAIENLGSLNGMASSSSGSTQSMFITNSGIYVRQGDGSGGPGYKNVSKTFDVADGERHNFKLYYDLDNLSFRVVVDGKLSKQVSYSLPKASLNSVTYNFLGGMVADIYKFGITQVDTEDLTVYTASTKDYEYSAGAPTDVYEGPVYAGQAVRYYAADYTGYRFLGWFQDGVEEAVSTEYIYDVVPESDICIYPKYEIKWVNITYYTADHVTFEGVEGDSWTTADFQRGLKPSAALEVCQPTLVLDDGYIFIGWANKDSGQIFKGDSYVNTPNDGSVPELVAVVRRAFTANVEGTIVTGELGRTVAVPVEANATLAMAKGVIEVTFNDELIEFVDETVADAYAGKVVVIQKTTPGLVEITINSDTAIEIADLIATLNFKVISMFDNTEITYNLKSVFGEGDEVLEMTEFTTTPSVVVAKVLKGDINMDAKIDVYDAVAVLRSIAGITSLDDNAAKAADVNGDGNITVTDATQILKYIARIITSF